MFLGIKEYLPSGPLEIVATVLSTLAMVMFIVSAAIKSKKKVLINQSVAQVFLIFSETVSGAWSSIIQDVVSLIRNIFVYFKKNTNKVNIILIVVGLVIGVYANVFSDNFFTPWKGFSFSPWYGYLPVIANLEYSIVILKKDINIKWIKLSFGVSCLLWGITFLIMGKALIISGFLNICTAIVSFVSFAKLHKKPLIIEEEQVE